MQNQLERIQQIAGMQRNFLRDFVPADAPESRMTEPGILPAHDAFSGSDTAGNGICAVPAVGRAV